MKKYTFLIAGGNPTLLIEGCDETQKAKEIERGLREFDQIGFVIKAEKYQLDMMGGELCINATLALAKLLGKTGSLKTSGLQTLVKYSISKNLATIKFNLPYKKLAKNTVLFDGIGFVFSQRAVVLSQTELSSLCSKYRLPAFGLVVFDGAQINPWIYVKKTNSLVRETACGSGSIALNILTGAKRIVQNSGGVIWVTKKGRKFTVSAEVSEKGGKVYGKSRKENN